MAEDNVQLTPEQEKLILEAFVDKDGNDIPSITELTQLAFPGIEDIDGRSKQGRAVKKLLATRGIAARTTATYLPMKRIDLSDSHKEFISKNRDKMTPVDLARTLFSNADINNVDIESRSVAEYIATLSPIQNIFADSRKAADLATEEYRPPKTVEGVLKRVDKYVFDHKIKKDEMTAAQKAGLTALLAYLNSLRFTHQINLYESQTMRDLFESTFVRYCYDKPDLLNEEVDQYVILSHEAVNSSSIQRRIERLNVMMDETSNGDNDSKARISMSLVEAINTLQTEYNQCVNRSQKLLDDLKQKRSDRLAELRSANASILNLVQLWKEEKSRNKFIKLAEVRKAARAANVEELSTMEEFKARVFGLNKAEIIDG